MRELGRILSRRRYLAALALILLLNGALFVREQQRRDYGLELELPAPAVFVFDGSAKTDAETPDARGAYRQYRALIGALRGDPPEEALDRLSARREALAEKIRAGGASEDEKLRYVAVNNVISRLSYLTGYGEWLEGIEKNKEDLLTFSIFNDPDSFSGRNIVKTAGEFRRLRGVELRLGADGAAEAVLSFPLSDYFLLLALLLTALSFLEERRAGLWSVVHASPGGRLGLGLKRAVILLAASALASAAIYGTDMALALYIYGGVDLTRAAQSVELLGRLPVLCTVGGFFGRFFLLRIFSAYFVALTLWLLLTAVNNVKYTVIVSAAALAAEYSLYALLPVQSAFNVLKYFNIFTYISLSDLYTSYLNIDLFGFPLGIRAISQGALPPLTLAAAAGCLAVQSLKRPEAGRDLLGRAAYGINSLTDRALRRLGPFGMELYKAAWLQKGAVVAAALVWAAAGLDFAAPAPVYTPAASAAREYTRELSGPLTDGTFARMDALEAELNGVLAARDAARAEYEAGTIGYPELDAYERRASAAQVSLEGLATVRDRAVELRALGEREGFAPWLIDETPLESVYGPRARANGDRAACLSVLALALMLSGVMAYERQSGMTPLLRSTPRGRRALARRKLLLAGAAAALVWAAVYGRELGTLVSVYAPDFWAAPVRGVSGLAEFPLPCSVGAALALLYAARLLALCCAGTAALALSALWPRQELSCVGAPAALLLPSVLYTYVGVGLAKPLAFTLALELTPLVLPRSGGLGAAALAYAAILSAAALSAAALLFSPRRAGMGK